MENSKILNQINQCFHNNGIKQESRFDLLLSMLEKNNKNEPCDQPEKYKEIINLLENLDYTNTDLIQEMFMFIGSKLTKFKLDQFYSPLTISRFINSFMIVGEEYKAIDPAGGTGDLLLFYNGKKSIWDIDDNALKLCKFNYELNKQTNYELVCKNSLNDFESDEGTYSYVAMNPPFGTSTLITDVKILEKYELGKGRKKQEIGILFVELGIKLLKNDGILFVILPSGYMGNGNKICSELRDLILKNNVIASLELPKNTFKRSGTGVNTYLLIIQKKNITVTEPHEILISGIENIGYNLSKKDTPLKYKVFKNTGQIMCNEDSKSILDNDFDDIKRQIISYANRNKILNIRSDKICDDTYEHIMSNKISSNILDIKRYKQVYLSTIQKMSNVNAKPVNKYSKIIKTTTKIIKTDIYKYIDIGEINSPLHSYKEMYGWELPSRAKYTVKKYDILISKLEGTMSYCVILSDDDNYISTNGVTVLRPTNMTSLYILFGNIVKKDFNIQHTAFLTGSIMASLSDDNISEFLIDEHIDIESTKKIIDTLELLYNLK